jgi:PAS domain S-box-containing protein
VLATTDLLAADPAFAALLPHGCGILAAQVSHDDASWLLWFRPEFARTVTWGGAPPKREVHDGDRRRLAPRLSFAAWAETVTGRSRPWTRADRQAADLLRTALVEEVLHLLSFRHLMLRRDLLRVRQAVEASSEPMVVCDSAGRVLVTNPAFNTLFGYTADDVRRGRVFSLRHAPFEEGPVVAALRRRLESDEPSWRVEAWLVAARGERTPVELRVDRIHDDEGGAIGFAATWHDLRERYRAAEERLALETRIQHAQKLESLGVLAGGIAHDFNNLLTSILGFISLAHEDLPAHSPAGESLEYAEMAAQRAAELCRQLLAYSGRGRFVIEPVALDRLIAEMRQLLDTVLSRNARLRVEAPAALPLVEGDATQLRQVVMNLLVNASDALGDRGGTITVVTHAAQRTAAELATFPHGDALPPGPYVELRVTDTGSGMDAATVARIFDPFFTTKFTGRGLGLAAVIGIVHGHRGALRVESAPGVGTTFTILLPAIAESVRPDAPGAASPTAAIPARTVLVVDDDDGVRRLATRALARAGHRVLEACGGDEAVALVAADPAAIDLVLLDLVMPGMSGAEALTALRTLRRDLVVVLTSGYDEQDASGLFDAGGAAAFVQKPYRASELVARLGTLLGRDS